MPPPVELSQLRRAFSARKMPEPSSQKTFACAYKETDGQFAYVHVGSRRPHTPIASALTRGIVTSRHKQILTERQENNPHREWLAVMATPGDACPGAPSDGYGRDVPRLRTKIEQALFGVSEAWYCRCQLCCERHRLLLPRSRRGADGGPPFSRRDAVIEENAVVPGPASQGPGARRNSHRFCSVLIGRHAVCTSSLWATPFFAGAFSSAEG